MPTVAGLTTEQKVITVPGDDTSINSAIAAEAEDQWLISSLTLSGSDVILLFTRTIPDS